MRKLALVLSVIITLWGTSARAQSASWVKLGKFAPTPVTNCTSSLLSGTSCSAPASATGGRNWNKLVYDPHDLGMLYWGGNPNSLAGTLSESMNLYDVKDAITACSSPLPVCTNFPTPASTPAVNNELLWSWLNYTGYNLQLNKIATISCASGSPNILTVTMQSGSFADVYLSHNTTSIVNAGPSNSWISGTGTWTVPGSGTTAPSGTYTPGNYDSQVNGAYQTNSILTFNTLAGGPSYVNTTGEYYQAKSFTLKAPGLATCPSTYTNPTTTVVCNQNQNGCIGAPLDDAQDIVGRHLYGGTAWDQNRNGLWAAFGTAAVGDPNNQTGNALGSVTGDSSITDFWFFDPTHSPAPQWSLKCTTQLPGLFPQCGTVGEEQEGSLGDDYLHDILFMRGGTSDASPGGRVYCISDATNSSRTNGVGACPAGVSANTWTAVNPSTAPWNTSGGWDFPNVQFDPNATVGSYTGEFVIIGGNVQESTAACPSHGGISGASFAAGFDEGGLDMYCQPKITYFWDPVNGYTAAHTSTASVLGVDMPSEPRNPPCGYSTARSSIICVAESGSGTTAGAPWSTPLPGITTASQVWEWVSGTGSRVDACGNTPAVGAGTWCLLTGITGGSAISINPSGSTLNIITGNQGGFDNNANAFFLIVNTASPAATNAYALVLPATLSQTLTNITAQNKCWGAATGGSQSTCPNGTDSNMPVTVGLPIAEGVGVTGCGDLSLELTSSGTPQPFQCSILDSWRPSGKSRVALTDYQEPTFPSGFTGVDSSYNLVYTPGAGGNVATPGNPLALAVDCNPITNDLYCPDTNHIIVRTIGAVSTSAGVCSPSSTYACFSVLKGNYNLIDAVDINAGSGVFHFVQSASHGANDGVMITGPTPGQIGVANQISCQAGCSTLYLSNQDSTSTTTIEDNGPIRAQLLTNTTPNDGSGHTYVDCRIRLTFWANRTDVGGQSICPQNARLPSNCVLGNTPPCTGTTGGDFNTAFKQSKAVEIVFTWSGTLGTANWAFANNTLVPTSGTFASSAQTANLYQAFSTKHLAADVTGFANCTNAIGPYCYTSPIARTGSIGSWTYAQNGVQINFGTTGSETTQLSLTNTQYPYGWGVVDNGSQSIEVGIDDLAGNWPKGLSFTLGGQEIHIQTQPDQTQLLPVSGDGAQDYLCGYPEYCGDTHFMIYFSSALLSGSNYAAAQEEFLDFQHPLIARASSIQYYNQACSSVIITLCFFPNPVPDSIQEDTYLMSNPGPHLGCSHTSTTVGSCLDDVQDSTQANPQPTPMAVYTAYLWGQGGAGNQHCLICSYMQNWAQRGYTSTVGSVPGRYTWALNFVKHVADVSLPHSDWHSSTLGQNGWRALCSGNPTSPVCDTTHIFDNWGFPFKVASVLPAGSGTANMGMRLFCDEETAEDHCWPWGIVDMYWMTGDHNLKDAIRQGGYDRINPQVGYNNYLAGPDPGHFNGGVSRAYGHGASWVARLCQFSIGSGDTTNFPCQPPTSGLPSSGIMFAGENMLAGSAMPVLQEHGFPYGLADNSGCPDAFLAGGQGGGPCSAGIGITGNHWSGEADDFTGQVLLASIQGDGLGDAIATCYTNCDGVTTGDTLTAQGCTISCGTGPTSYNCSGSFPAGCAAVVASYAGCTTGGTILCITYTSQTPSSTTGTGCTPTTSSCTPLQLNTRSVLPGDEIPHAATKPFMQSIAEEGIHDLCRVEDYLRGYDWNGVPFPGVYNGTTFSTIFLDDRSCWQRVYGMGIYQDQEAFQPATSWNPGGIDFETMFHFLNSTPICFNGACAKIMLPKGGANGTNYGMWGYMADVVGPKIEIPPTFASAAAQWQPHYEQYQQQVQSIGSSYPGERYAHLIYVTDNSILSGSVATNQYFPDAGVSTLQPVQSVIITDSSHSLTGLCQAPTSTCVVSWAGSASLSLLGTSTLGNTNTPYWLTVGSCIPNSTVLNGCGSGVPSLPITNYQTFYDNCQVGSLTLECTNGTGLLANSVCNGGLNAQVDAITGQSTGCWPAGSRPDQTMQWFLTTPVYPQPGSSVSTYTLPSSYCSVAGTVCTPALYAYQHQPAISTCTPSVVTLTPGPTFSFGSISLGGSSAQSFQLCNGLSTSIAPIAPSVSGTNSADFPYSIPGGGGCGTSLASNTGCNITITFTPSVSGSRTAALNVNYGGGSGTVLPTLSDCAPATLNTAVTGLGAGAWTIVLPNPCPSTTGNWGTHQTVTIPSSVTALTIQGGTTCSAFALPTGITCTDNTVIKDIDTADTDYLFKVISSSSSTVVRMTGMTFQSSTGADKQNGAIQFAGPMASLRIDNSHLNSLTGTPQPISIRLSSQNAAPGGGGCIYGVADHNLFDGNSSSIEMYADSCSGSQDYGDYNWAQPTGFGNASAFFIENNTFNGNSSGNYGSMTDCYEGGKQVIRYNVLNNTGVQTHPTGGASDWRGCRSTEIYNNNVNGTYTPGFSTFFFLSSGPALIHDNTFTGGTNFQSLIRLVESRDGSVYGPAHGGLVPPPNNWGFCGAAPVVTGTLTANGTTTVTSSAAFNTGWNPGGPIIINGILYAIGTVTSTSSMTVSPLVPTGSGLSFTVGSAWDQNSNTSSYACIDQPGRGVSDLITGTFPSKVDSVGSIIQWPHQALEPVYEWSNTYSGSHYVLANPSVDANIFVANQDYYANTTFSYTPYTYPHPLTAGSGSVSVALSGTGVSTTVTLNPTSQTFNPTVIGTGNSGDSPRTFTLSTTGSITISSVTLIGANASQFNIHSTTCSGSISTSCAVTINFAPSVVGNPLIAQLQIVYTGGSGGTLTSNLSGVGLPVPTNIFPNPIDPLGIAFGL